MTENLWTPTCNGKTQHLVNTLKVFETKKKCDAYIKETFPPTLIKMGKIKSNKITITLC